MPKTDDKPQWMMRGITSEPVENYLYSLLPARDEVLVEMEIAAARRDIPIVGPAVGRILHQLALMTDSKNVFEMGSAIGYSTIWWARAVGKGGRVFYTDGDGQYDPGELPLLLKLAGRATGLVNGYKLERHDSAHRIWIGNVYNFCARFLFRIRIRDIDCDYRLIRRALLDQIHLTSTSGTICVELVRKLEMSGCDVAEVGVHHYPRLHGRSQFFRVRSLAVTLGQLLRLWWELIV